MLAKPKTLALAPGEARRSLKMSASALVHFTQELSNLIQAGLPLFQALSIVHKQDTKGALKKLLPFLISRIYGGFSLSSSLAYYPHIFSPIYLSLIQVGESSGKLGQQLDYLLKHLKRIQKTKQMVQTTLLYPFIVSLCMAVVSFLLLFYVVPKFEGILNQSIGRASLPLLTKSLIGLSAGLHSHLMPMGFGAIALLLALYTMLKRKKPFLTALICGLPGLKPLLLKIHLARFTHTLATGLRSGLSLLKSLDLAQPTLALGSLQLACRRIQHNIQKGLTFSEAIKREEAFPLALSSLVEIGEASGSLQSVLETLSESYQEQAESHLKKLSVLLEPAVIIILSMFVGLVVLGLFLPMLQLMQGL